MSTDGLLAALIAISAVSMVALIWIAVRQRRRPSQRSSILRMPLLCGQCRHAMAPESTRCGQCGWTPPALLEFTQGPLVSQSLVLSQEITTLGSVAGNTVVLADPGVSRKHAGIRKLASSYELADLGSTNGVYVNGERVPKKTLEAGDVIRIGSSEAVFRRT